MQARTEQPDMMPARYLTVMGLYGNEHSRERGNRHHEDGKCAKGGFSGRMQQLRHCLEKQVCDQPPESEESHDAENCGCGYLHAMTIHGFSHGIATCGCCIGIPIAHSANNISALRGGGK